MAKLAKGNNAPDDNVISNFFDNDPYDIGFYREVELED